MYSLYTIFVYLDLTNGFLHRGFFMLFWMSLGIFYQRMILNAFVQFPRNFEGEFLFASWFFQICFLVANIQVLRAFAFYDLSKIGETMGWTLLSESPYGDGSAEISSLFL